MLALKNIAKAKNIVFIILVFALILSVEPALAGKDKSGSGRASNDRQRSQPAERPTPAPRVQHPPSVNRTPPRIKPPSVSIKPSTRINPSRRGKSSAVVPIRPYSFNNPAGGISRKSRIAPSATASLQQKFNSSTSTQTPAPTVRSLPTISSSARIPLEKPALTRRIGPEKTERIGKSIGTEQAGATTNVKVHSVDQVERISSNEKGQITIGKQNILTNTVPKHASKTKDNHLGLGQIRSIGSVIGSGKTSLPKIFKQPVLSKDVSQKSDKTRQINSSKKDVKSSSVTAVNRPSAHSRPVRDSSLNGSSNPPKADRGKISRIASAPRSSSTTKDENVAGRIKKKFVPTKEKEPPIPSLDEKGARRGIRKDSVKTSPIISSGRGKKSLDHAPKKSARQSKPRTDTTNAVKNNNVRREPKVNVKSSKDKAPDFGEHRRAERQGTRDKRRETRDEQMRIYHNEKSSSHALYYDHSHRPRYVHRNEHVYWDSHDRLCHRIVWPGYRFIVHYWRGPYCTFGYVYPYYLRKYIFVSLGGYWPVEYSCIRYYWYGCHPYWWYGYYPIAREVGTETYNYYTYNYYYDTGGTAVYQPTAATDYIQPVDHTTFADVREKLAKQQAAEPNQPTLADIYFDEAVAAFEEADYATATEKFAKATELAPDDLILPFAYAQALFANEQYTEAASVLRNALAKVTPEKEGVFYPRGLYPDDDVLFEQIDQLNEKTQQYSFDADLQLLLGYQLLGVGEIDQALEPLQNAMEDLENTAAANVLLTLLEKIKADTKSEN